MLSRIGQTHAVSPATPHSSFGTEELEQRVLLSTIPASALNVTDYGVVGDGHTDNFVALTAAIGAAKSAGVGLYFPNGTYIFNGNMNAEGVPLYG